MFGDTGVCVCMCMCQYIIWPYEIICIYILYAYSRSYVYIYIFLLNKFQNFHARDTQAKNLGWMFGPTQVVSRFC